MSPKDAPAEDLFAPAAIPSPPPDLGYVLCDFAGITVAIPQADVAAIEHGSALTAPMPDEAAIGWFESRQGPWPAYALDSQLQLMREAPSARSFLVFVNSAPWPAGVLCESVRIVGSREALDLQPLPLAMRNHGGPVDRVARLGPNRLALACYPGAMAAHLEHCTMQEPHDE